MIKVTPFIYEELDDIYANTYLLSDEENSCVVIDPSKDNLDLVNYIKKEQLHLKAILITHGHFDHIRGVDVLAEYFSVPVYIGFNEIDKLTDSYQNCSALVGKPLTIETKALPVRDQEVLSLLNEDIIVIETPYHTSGSVCYFLKKSQILFTGDFLFSRTVGRCDLPSSKPEMLKTSMAKILALPAATVIYAGHGKRTSLQEERQLNPFIKQ